MKPCNYRLLRVLPLLAAACIFPLLSDAQNMNTGAYPVPTLPNINTNFIVNVTNVTYGAVGDGVTTNTTAIQNAINAAAAGGNVGGLFGGTVEIPAPGTYMCGPLTLKNNVNIQIDAGATLQMLPESVWITLPPQNLTYGDLIYGTSVTNIEISGSGTIDGNGADWWASSGSIFSDRPYMIFFNGKCNRVLVRGVTVQNPPIMHFVFKNSGDGNITFQNMTINTTASNAANTDGIDLVGTNCLFQNCTINAGDDNIALGSSSASAYSANILVTNCAFGVGHGISIGSNTAGSVSNLTVINCTFNGTDYGIRMKSCTNSSGGSGEGGIAQNLSYLNLGMTNIVDGAIVIYSYYSSSLGGIYGTPTSVTPLIASTQTVGANAIPVWRNITISNVTATVASGGVSGIIWGRMEVPATNIVFDRVNISGPQSFDVYNASGIQFIDCQITNNAGDPTFELFNAQVIVSNSVPTNTLFTFDGLTANISGSVLTNNTMAFYNAQGSLKNTNVFNTGPLTISASTLAVSNNLKLFPSTVLNYTLGTNTTEIAVATNLVLGGTINIASGAGFTGGTYTLLAYGGTLSSNLLTLGTTPAGYTYSINTNTAGQVNLLVIPPPPGIPTNLVASPTNLAINLTWSTPTNAAGYNLRRSTTNGGTYFIIANVAATNYSDTALTNAVKYYYVVSATNAGAESANSAQASATPLPSSVSTNINFQFVPGQMQLSWPQDHLGWRLQIQTNNLGTGLGADWVNVANSTNVDQMNISIGPTNGSVFLRLVYP